MNGDIREQKTPNAVKARGAHGALRAQHPTSNIERRMIQAAVRTVGYRSFFLTS
jgi:hypothetical protein